MWWTIYVKDGGNGELYVVILVLNSCALYLDQSHDRCLQFPSSQVTDLALARDNQNDYVQYRSSEGVARPGIDLNVTVLTTGFWPTYKSSDLNLPSEMVQPAKFTNLS